MRTRWLIAFFHSSSLEVSLSLFADHLASRKAREVSLALRSSNSEHTGWEFEFLDSLSVHSCMLLLMWVCRVKYVSLLPLPGPRKACPDHLERLHRIPTDKTSRLFWDSFLSHYALQLPNVSLTGPSVAGIFLGIFSSWFRCTFWSFLAEIRRKLSPQILFLVRVILRRIFTSGVLRGQLLIEIWCIQLTRYF